MSSRRSDKPAQIVRAARTVFGRDGYTRAGIDAIAAEAGVSTRTIYSHFGNKERLFTTVLTASAAEVADGFTTTVDRLLDGDLDRVTYLRRLGEALITQSTAFPEHFAMVRQITVEAAHFPADALAAWRAAGPDRVEAEIARRLAARDDLRVPDPHLATNHFMALTSSRITVRTYWGAVPITPAAISASVAAGVEAFLHGYAE